MIDHPSFVAANSERDRSQADGSLTDGTQGLALRVKYFQAVLSGIQRKQITTIRGQHQRANGFCFEVREAVLSESMEAQAAERQSHREQSCMPKAVTASEL
jgi:hypothetical protein